MENKKNLWKIKQTATVILVSLKDISLLFLFYMKIFLYAKLIEILLFTLLSVTASLRLFGMEVPPDE